VDDLHRHKIDHFTIPSSRGPEFGVLRRVDDVRFLNRGYSADCLDLHYWVLLFFPLEFHFRLSHNIVWVPSSYKSSVKTNNNQM
jgi:hypothetical protein